ncbi:intraflagellar transport protein 88 homolog isoform X2 [Leptidea sinapis]|nr:intraflagellar transport protein 88 homolog isoform X2 [Leptidea sinapis]
MFRIGTVNVRGPGASRAGTASTRPVTAHRAAGFTSATRDTSAKDEKKEDTIEDKVKQMEARIMSLVEESCMLSARPAAEDNADEQKRENNLAQALAKAQEASALERQLIRMQEQANLGDSHNLDLTFCVLCNLADQYALNEMYTEALNTYQLLTKNKLFPHANRLKVNMGNIHFKMGEHPKALKLYRMALDQTPTAEKDLRMKVMHNIGLLLVRMGKFRDAVTNFQHIMQEQGDFQTGLHLVLCSVALDDAEGGKAAFHSMLDVEPPNYHHDIAIDDENDAYECVVRDVVRGDRLSRWSRAGASHADRCLALAAAALERPPSRHALRDEDSGSASWCVEALRGYSGGGAGTRLELGSALASLRSATAAGGGGTAAGVKALQRLKTVARSHPNDRVLRAEANADAAFIAYALSKWSEARSLSEAACRDDPYSCAARVTAALSELAASNGADDTVPAVVNQLSAATHLDPANVIAMHDLALVLEMSGEENGAEARWQRIRSGAGAGAGKTLRALAACGLARLASPETAPALEHWYSTVGTCGVSASCALGKLYSDLGDTQSAKHHYQDVEAVWPCELSALEWLAKEATPDEALQYYRRAARIQPTNPKWGLLIGSCLRASGRYQDALSVYKKLNANFPDNVQCLKLLVKLCGDQGLSETKAWSRELQRAQARVKQLERAATVTSAGSGSSHTSQSPIDQFKISRSDSGIRSESRTPASAHRQSSGGRPISTRLNTSETRSSLQPIKRSVNRQDSKQKYDIDEDLPLPPEQ